LQFQKQILFKGGIKEITYNEWDEENKK